MPKVSLGEIATYLDSYLRIADVPDEPNAVNGLQVENGGQVGSIVAAVDASQATIDGVAAAADGESPLLLVHHGLFWDGQVPLTGRRYRRVLALFEQDVAVYAAHIPLDLHPEVGNNVVLADRLGIGVEGWFGDYHGVPIGVWGHAPQRLAARDSLLIEVSHALGASASGTRLIAGGPRGRRPGRYHHGGRGQHDRRRPGCRPGHLHHRRRRPPYLFRRDGVGRQRAVRGALCNGDARRAGPGVSPRRAVRPRVGIPRSSDRAVTALIPALDLRGIHKHFGPVHALRGADFTIMPGELHALLGENGAGKSTLMLIAYGLVRPDRGEIRVGGASRVIASPRAARQLGLGMVHQHFTSVPALTVGENVALAAGWPVSPGALARRVRALSESLGLPLDPDAMAGTLSVGLKQRLEFVKALATDTRILLLDEPTAVLAPAEADELLREVRAFTAGGGSAVLITHKLDEALAVADRVTVLRRGEVVFSGPVAGQTSAVARERDGGLRGGRPFERHRLIRRPDARPAAGSRGSHGGSPRRRRRARGTGRVPFGSRR